MPIYEYKCADCGKHIEKMQKVSDAPPMICENCGGKLEKQWSLSGIQFKGEGWYVTDYANKKPEKSEKSEKTAVAEKSSASESTAKTESASNKSNDSPKSNKTESVSKKD
ncbi:hypothetical protein BH10ACI1_BH10ACI1_02580 [soil metagenome]